MMIASFIAIGKEIQRAAETVSLGNEMFWNLNDQIKQLLQVLENRFTTEIEKEDVVMELYTFLVEITAFVRKQAMQNYIVVSTLREFLKECRCTNQGYMDE